MDKTLAEYVAKLLSDYSKYDEQASEIKDVMQSFVEILTEYISKYTEVDVQFYIKRNDENANEYIIYMSIQDRVPAIIARYKMDSTTAYPVLLKYDSFIILATNKKKLEKATLQILKEKLNPLIAIINESKTY